MHTPTLITILLSTLLHTNTFALPAGDSPKIIEERHTIIVEKRQADVSQLLQLASLAGISALPTDPAVLFSLGPLANSLAAALPTPSVLSVLLTAAPSNFVSQVINDPAYASSFEGAFSAGSSPSWFTALPTDVRSYLHTYSGFGVLAGAAGGVEKAESATATAGSGNGTATGGNGTAAGMTGTATSGGTSLTSGAASTTGGTSSGSMSSEAGSSSAAGSGASSATTAGAASSASSQGGAATPTGALAAGIVGVVGGVLGVVALL